MEYLKTRGIRPILPGQDEDGIIITFDDGTEAIYDYAYPILRRFKVPALIFIVVDYIGKKNLWDLSLTGKYLPHLSWPEICEMKDSGIEVGSHTMSHRNLTRLTTQEVDYELSESRRVLIDRLGSCDSISYPFNRIDQRVVQRAVRAGYRFGFGGGGDDQMSLKKEAVYITDTRYSLGVKIFEWPRLLYKYERLKQKVINYFTITTMVGKR